MKVAKLETKKQCEKDLFVRKVLYFENEKLDMKSFF
jgi:hypothetical protein